MSGVSGASGANAGRPGAAPARHRVRLHLWLEANGRVSFGLGRLLLLEEVAAQGSLRAAADKLGMSYRAAWGKIKSSEQLLGQPLLEKRGGNRTGYALTPFGRQLMEEFKTWFAVVERFADEEAARRLPVATRGYDESDASPARLSSTARDAQGSV